MKNQENVHSKMKWSVGNCIFNVVNITVFSIFAFICIYPIYYVLINSVSSADAVARGQVLFFPKGFQLQNYIDVFRLKGVGSAVLTSVARTVIGTVTGVSAAMILGYAVSKKEYWHRKFWYRFMVVTMYFSAGMIPVYINYANLGLLNNFLVYILPTLIVPYHMILSKTFIENLPESLEEAAYMDGAGYFTRFVRIIVPLCKPIMATIAIYASVSQWNSYQDTLLYMKDGSYRTLQYILYQYMNQTNMVAELVQTGAVESKYLTSAITPEGVRYTVTAITVLPILCVYPFFQRHFTKGIMVGAIKG